MNLLAQNPYSVLLGFVVIGPVHDLLDGFNSTMGESAVGDIVTSLIQKSFRNHYLLKKDYF